MQKLSIEEKTELTRMIMSLLDSWNIRSEHQISVLSLPQGTRLRMLRRYRDDTPFPDDENVMERIEHIVGIAEALHTTFPRNANMAAQWMNQPHRRFSNRTPVSLMVEDGLSGIISVRAQLDCAFAWSQSED